MKGARETKGHRRFLRKTFKWSAITLGGLIGLVAILGTIAETIATPEDKARWAAESAVRDKERQLEKAAEAKRETEELAARQRAEAEKAAGACLDSRYMFDILWDVKQSLREPNSFEHIRSSATSIDENGVQRILIEFRARNGFGGMNIGKAVANVQFEGCKLLDWRIIEG